MDINKEPFDNHEGEEEVIEEESKMYSMNNIIIAIALFTMIYMFVNKPKRVVVEQSSTTNNFMTNLIILAIIAAVFYFYNYRSEKTYTKTEQNIYKKQSKNKNVLPRFTNSPEILDRKVDTEIEDDSIESYLHYFKQFNKPLVKDIKKDLQRFNLKVERLMTSDNDTLLVQELDNLNLLKRDILNQVESLIYSIDVANIKTEKMYHVLNSKVKERLSNSYNFTKNFTKKRKSDDMKKCKSDVNIFSGVLLSEGEVLPSNY